MDKSELDKLKEIKAIHINNFEKIIKLLDEILGVPHKTMGFSGFDRNSNASQQCLNKIKEARFWAEEYIKLNK